MFIQEVRRQENGHYKPPLAVLAADQVRRGQLVQKPLRPPHSVTFQRDEPPKILTLSVQSFCYKIFRWSSAGHPADHCVSALAAKNFFVR